MRLLPPYALLSPGLASLSLCLCSTAPERASCPKSPHPPQPSGQQDTGCWGRTGCCLGIRRLRSGPGVAVLPRSSIPNVHPHPTSERAGRPRPHLGEWGGWANGQSSCPARAAECPGSQESMAPVSSGWSARARGAVGPGPPASQAGAAAAPSAGPGEHCGSLGAASPRVPGGLRQSRAGWHVSSTVQSRALSPGATVTSQPLRLQSWPGWQDQTGRVPAVTRLVRSSCGSGR